jgi:pimeloyl-ACP methyl ester carboxylesterase
MLFDTPRRGAPIDLPLASFPPGAAAQGKFVHTRSGDRIRYVSAGEGPPVVLIHGALVTLEDMLIGPFDALAERFGVTAFDRPGHGLSRRGRLQGSPWTQARMLHEAVQALGLERPVLVGHSYGGAVALAYALLYPNDTRGLAVLAPVAFPEIRLEQVLFGPRAIPLFGELLQFGFGRAMDDAVLPVLWEAMFKPQPMPERFRIEFPFALAGRPEGVQANGEDANAVLTSMVLEAASYGQCRVRVKVLAGTDDLVVSPSRHARPLAAALPKADLRMLPGLGHMLHHFAVDEVVRAVEELQGG